MFAIKNKITIDKIINFVKQIAPDTQVLSTEYLDEKSPLFFLCSCGKQFTKSWTTIQSVKTCKCRTCTRKDGWENKRRTSKEKDKWVKESINYGFTPLEPIKRIKDKFLCQDDNGYKGYISLENIRLNKHFSVFSIHFNSDNLIYNLNIFLKNNGFETRAINYHLYDNKTINTKVECICECGKHFITNLGNIIGLQKNRCDYCSKRMSNLEKLVDIELNKYSKNFIFQKRFKDCVGEKGAILPFDFYLPEQNLCIEVDGDQHEKIVDFSGNKSEEELIQELIVRKRNDSIKTKYCMDNNINLLRINYRKFKKKSTKYKQIIANIFN